MFKVKVENLAIEYIYKGLTNYPEYYQEELDELVNHCGYDEAKFMNGREFEVETILDLKKFVDEANDLQCLADSGCWIEARLRIDDAGTFIVNIDEYWND